MGNYRELLPVSSKSKTALVLSPGGLFGAYQAGVWRYLSESGFQPDIVIGASVGALNGWAIAAGCNAEELCDRWLDKSQTNVLLRRAKSGIRSGFFHREPLQNLTDSIFNDYNASSHFGLIVVELPFLRSRLINGATATPKHLLASASIPVAMPTVTINGQRFTDGGLLEDVPLWAAAKMGATKVIAVDAMAFECPAWYRAAISPLEWFAPRTPSALKSQTTLIRPNTPLGHFSEALTWNLSSIQRWLERGYEDARRTLTASALATAAA